MLIARWSFVIRLLDMNLRYCRLWSMFARVRYPVSGCHKENFQRVLLSRAMSSVPKELEEDLKRNPYYEKYATKIRELQQGSPDDFKSRVEEFNSQKTSPKFGPARDGSYSSVSQPKEALGSHGTEYHKAKALNDIMKVDLIENMTADEVSKLWETHFKNKDAISATIPKDLYSVMYERGMKFPIFVLPLPRGQGYEFFVCQVARQEVHFTSLINYQAHKENAPECLTMIHYTELEDKGVILMHGEFNKDVLNVKEAQCLANQFLLYYGKDNEKRLKLLERLNCNPNDFKHMDLIAELECLSIDTS